MDFAASPFQISLLTASALLMAWIGLFAAFRRGHFLTTLLFSASFLSLAALQAGTIGILQADSPVSSRAWATYLAGVSALASWLWLSMSVVLARPDPWVQIRHAGAYLALALAGCVAMFLVSNTPLIVREVSGTGGDAVIVLAGMGKVYLMYLVVVMVAVLMNLERMLRTAPASVQKRLRSMFLAVLIGILSQLMVVSAGLLYGGLRVSWMAAGALPLFAMGVVASLALARRRLSDISVPLARPVVYYSSVSLTLAGAFLLTMAVLSKVLPVLSPEWKRWVSVVFYLLVGGGGIVLAISPRVSRAIRRFIDRNFYANRYDYRREWERVTNALTPSSSLLELAQQADTLLCSVFEAERTALYLRDDRAPGFHRLSGPAAMPETLACDNLLALELARTRAPVVFDDLVHDLERIPIAVDNRAAIHALRAAVCAPLAVGDEMLGMVWLSEKRTDETYTLEDVEFLGSVARHLAAALWFAYQAERLAESRQIDSLGRLSTLVLHDIKNQVSGLSLVVENARRHMGNPEFQREALAVIERAVGSLKDLMAQVASVSRPPEVLPDLCALEQILDEGLVAAGLARGEQDGLRVTVDSAAVQVRVDRRHIVRVVANLLVNAREALPGGRGEIELRSTVSSNGPSGGDLTLLVRDNGRGMSEEFVRTGLYRPFSTTKPGGLGIGLTQVKGIVEGHGGTISVTSRPGEGTSFTVRLPGVAIGMFEAAR